MEAAWGPELPWRGNSPNTQLQLKRKVTPTVESHWDFRVYFFLMYPTLTHHLAKIPSSAFLFHLDKIPPPFPWPAKPNMCPAHLLMSPSWPLLPHSLCPSYTSLQRMSEHAKPFPPQSIFTRNSLAWNMLLPALTLSWHSPHPRGSREAFLDHLSWRDSICHSVSPYFMFTLAFITPWLFSCLFNCLFPFLSVLFTADSSVPSKEPGADSGLYMYLLCRWMNKEMPLILLPCVCPKSSLCLVSNWTVVLLSTAVLQTFPKQAYTNSNHMLCSWIGGGGGVAGFC